MDKEKAIAYLADEVDKELQDKEGIAIGDAMFNVWSRLDTEVYNELARRHNKEVENA